MVRLASVLLLLAACGERIDDDTRWRVVERSELADVTYVDASGTGADVWAAGHLDGASVIANYDRGNWSRFEPASEVAVAISAVGSRVWIIDELGHLARLAGEQWNAVDLTDTLGVPEPEDYEVRDVWGSGPEDVYAIAALLLDTGFVPETVLVHFDGDAWTVDDSWRDLLTIGAEEFAWLRHGCGGGVDVWLSVERLDDGMGYSAEVLHGNGAGWTRDEIEIFAPLDSFITQLACRGSVAWAAGPVAGGVYVARSGSPWTAVGVPGTRDAIALTAGEDEAWLVAGEVIDGARVPQIWRLTEDLAEPTLDGDLGLDALAPGLETDLPPLTAAWATASGRAFVLGVDGIILERAP